MSDLLPLLPSAIWKNFKKSQSIYLCIFWENLNEGLKIEFPLLSSPFADLFLKSSDLRIRSKHGTEQRSRHGKHTVSCLKTTNVLMTCWINNRNRNSDLSSKDTRSQSLRHVFHGVLRDGLNLHITHILYFTHIF